jgi:serine phosphatase RsbU (regulator of sigma subunit)
VTPSDGDGPGGGRVGVGRESLRYRELDALIRTPVVPDVPQVPAAVFDPDRLMAVVKSGLLDTEPETRFDDLVHLARDVVGGQHAFFTVVDANRSFWKSVVGVDTGAGREGRVGDSLSQIIIATNAPLVVDDVRHDERVRHLGVVRTLGMGACIGYPVRDGVGQVIGSLCVSSSVERRWSADERRAVATLARAVSAEVQLRRARTSFRDQVDQLQRAHDEQAALARSLQDSLLPPILPAIPGIDAAAAYLPAGHGVEVVGDFYDLFEADRHWCAVMGDVCGHGVEAAKLTALARYTLRTEAAHHRAKPREVLIRLHQALIAQHGRGRMLTAVIAMLRPEPDGVRGNLCSAGHEPPLIRRANDQVDRPRTRGHVLGVMKDVVLHDTPFVLGPADALVLYTDGVTEARAGRGRELFGDQRLADVLAERCGGLDAAGIVDQVMQAVAEHSNGYHSDDTAVMVLRVSA